VLFVISSKEKHLAPFNCGTLSLFFKSKYAAIWQKKEKEINPQFSMMNGKISGLKIRTLKYQNDSSVHLLFLFFFSDDKHIPLQEAIVAGKRLLQPQPQ